MRKKLILILVLLCISVYSLFGCGNSEANVEVEKKYSIVCTIFPQYDWVKNILGDQIENFELHLLLDDGVDLHSYQPTAEDISKITECDMFIYTGGESDEWVEDALGEVENKDITIINMMDVLGSSVLEEEVVEGMEHEHEHEEGEIEEVENDEHVWLSIGNSLSICESIYTSISSLDSENKEVYKENYESYKNKLENLDTEYSKAVESASIKNLVFGDRFPFRYLLEDYGLDYFAAFLGCSAETEASFETVIFLAEKADEIGAPVIFVLESSDQSIAETIIANTNNKDQEIVVLNSMQSITAQNIEDGADYISIMGKNLVNLKKALN